MTNPEPYRLSPEAALSGVDSFTWSDEESIAYEVAIENITEASGWYVAKLREERGKDAPDPAVVEQCSQALARCVQDRDRLDPDDRAEVIRVRAEYGELVRRLLRGGA